MRAIRIAGSTVPKRRSFEIDEPNADGEVLIDVHAAGVASPDAPRCNPAGSISTRRSCRSCRAPRSRAWCDARRRTAASRGRPVAGLTMLNGGMAEVVALQPDRVFKLPDNVSFEAGAGLLFNDLTMHHALRTRGRLTEGETVLVHGAAGGIGTSTLRLAPAWGASRMIAVVSTEDKGEVARGRRRIRCGAGRGF